MSDVRSVDYHRDWLFVVQATSRKELDGQRPVDRVARATGAARSPDATSDCRSAGNAVEPPSGVS